MIGLAITPSLNIKAEEGIKYHYISDVERWYYERQSYEYYPHGGITFPLHPYSAYFHPYGTDPFYPYYDDFLYYPYSYSYSVARAIGYRNVKVFEYYLTLSSPLGEAMLSGDGWYREGSSVMVTASATVDSGQGVRHVFSEWSGDLSSSSPTHSVTMDKPKTVIANYKTRYWITMKSTPLESLGFIEEGWYSEGSLKPTPTAAEVVKDKLGKRYVFNGWYVDGIRIVGNPISVTIDKPITVEVRYETQHYLTVESLYGDPIGAGWYDEDIVASFSVSSPLPAGYGRKWVFDSWRGDIETAQPQGSIIMDAPKRVTATWMLDSTMLYATYGVIIVAIGMVILGLILIVRRVNFVPRSLRSQ